MELQGGLLLSRMAAIHPEIRRDTIQRQHLARTGIQGSLFQGNAMPLTLLIFSVLAFGLHGLCQPSHQRSIIRSIVVKRPNIVVHGANLSKVEVWAVPTGTGITPDEYTLLGTANHRNAAGEDEVWVFPIPSDPLSATEIFATGFDATGKSVSIKSLPYRGASQIYDVLWVTNRITSTQHETERWKSH